LTDFNPNYTYLFLMLFTLAGPLALSFDSRVRYVTKWPLLVPGILISLVYFVLWDSWFVHEGIWSFNPDYIIGWELFRLPMEEWLFFIMVPFACLFIYECCNYYIKKDWLGKSAYYINAALIVILLVVVFFRYDKVYTMMNFMSAIVLMLLHQFVFKPKWLGRFYISYIFSLIPFFLVNGVLTALPVVSYNDAENLGIRIGTIPIEDSIYCLLLLLMNTTFFEWMRQKKSR